MTGNGDRRRIEFLTSQDIRNWLEENHGRATSFWLVTYKKHVTAHYVPYGDIVDELLCYGWIDARTRRVDDDRTMLLVAPRKAGSTWSAANRKRVARLVAKGRMKPVGQAKVDAAKKDGSWTYLDDIENLVIPGDLESAFQKNKAARRQFSAFNDAAKKVILLWIKNAKREQTRATRIGETVRLAAKGVKAAHPEAKGE